MKVRLAKRSTWFLIAGLLLQAVALLTYQAMHSKLVRKDARGYEYVAREHFSRSSDNIVLPNAHFLSPDTTNFLSLYFRYGYNEVVAYDGDWNAADQYHLLSNINITAQNVVLNDIDSDGLDEMLYVRAWPEAVVSNDRTRTTFDSVWVCAFGKDQQEVVIQRLTPEILQDLFAVPQASEIQAMSVNFDTGTKGGNVDDPLPYFALHVNMNLTPLEYRRGVLMFEKGEIPKRISSFQTSIITYPGVWSKLNNGQLVYTFGGSPPANGRTVQMALGDGTYVKLVDDRNRALQVDPNGTLQWIRDLGAGGGATRVFPCSSRPDHLVLVSIRGAFVDIPSVFACELNAEENRITDSLRWQNAGFSPFYGAEALANGYVGRVVNDIKTTTIIRDHPSSSYTIPARNHPVNQHSSLLLRLADDRLAYLNAVESDMLQLVDVENGDVLMVLHGEYVLRNWHLPVPKEGQNDRFLAEYDDRTVLYEIVENPFFLWPVWHHRWLLVFTAVPLLLTLLVFTLSEIRHRRREEWRQKDEEVQQLNESLKQLKQTRDQLQTSLAKAGEEAAVLQQQAALTRERELQLTAIQQQSDHSRLLHLAQLESLLNAVDEGLAELDEQGRIVQANEAFAQACGVLLSALVGKPAHQVLGVTDNSLVPWFREEEHHPRIGGTLEVDVELPDRGGGPKLRKKLRMQMYPFPGSGRHRLLVLHRDIPVEAVDVVDDSVSRFGELITCSPVMKQVFEDIQRALDEDFPTLVIGENGVGKTQILQGLRDICRHRKVPFVEHSPVAIPSTVLESTLFGTKRGGYTGAVDSPGLFKAADGGVLFLDEIGELPLDLQAKLLKATERRPNEILPVGTSKPVKVDVKLITATNRDLEELMSAKRFREDLYHRLTGRIIHIPALRERPEDIPLLVKHFLERYRKTHDNKQLRVENRTLVRLREYNWPGNVRQLERAITVAASSAQEDVLRIDDSFFRKASTGNGLAKHEQVEEPVHETPVRNGHSTPEPSSPKKRPRPASREELLAALEEHGNNVTQLARAYGYTRATVHNWMSRYGVKIRR